MSFNLTKSSLNVTSIVKQIKAANSILLTTHKQCDGDGLGAMLGLYHALKKLGKQVRVLTVDAVPKKYHFLNIHQYLEIFDQPHTPIQDTDLTLIFDTNDRRLLEPLWFEIEKKCKNILFIDHHPVLNQGPEPTPGSFIDTRAASTGEISFFIIKELGVRLDALISRALYTSICFDTQLFRYVRSAPTSHLICAELLEYERHPEEIHGHLFATFSANKLTFLAKILANVEYSSEGRIATVLVSTEDLSSNNLLMDDARDVIDMIMNIGSVQIAALYRQDEVDGYKLSLRSKGNIEILGVAETYGGGGHLYAAGVFLRGEYSKLKTEIGKLLSQRLDNGSKN